jgi:hypothetical protein
LKSSFQNESRDFDFEKTASGQTLDAGTQKLHADNLGRSNILRTRAVVTYQLPLKIMQNSHDFMHFGNQA